MTDIDTGQEPSLFGFPVGLRNRLPLETQDRIHRYPREF